MTTLVAFSGSTRSASFHTRIVNAMAALAPSDVRIAMFDLSDVPFYNQDLEGDALPESVQALRAAVVEADGLIFAAPEYNGSYSALTKNTIDWLSRPYGSRRAERQEGGSGECDAWTRWRKACDGTDRLLGFFGNTVVSTVNSPTIHEKIDATSDVVTDGELATQLREALASF